jgi:hypothetical protein
VKKVPSLIDVLRSTFKQLEQTIELRPDDPALRELKRSILTAIAELEVRKSEAA